MKLNYNQIRECVKDFRKKFNLVEDKPIQNLNEILDKSFLILRFPNNMKISGATFIKKDVNITYKCIYINNNEPVGRQNFTLAHELYHVFYESSEKVLCMEEDFREDTDNIIEKKAETFASNLLIPRILLLVVLKKMGLSCKNNITEHNVFKIQDVFGVTFQSIIYTIENMKNENIQGYNKFNKYVPKIPNYLKKYYKSGWDELETKSKKYNPKFILNSPSPKYVIPSEFKRNLIDNYKRKLIDYEEIEDIFNFFEIEDELKVI